MENQAKSAHINFTYKQNTKMQLEINGQPIPFANEAKYLGMNLAVRLKWKAHMKKKKDQLEIIIIIRRNLSWLIGRRSQITIDNKLPIYIERCWWEETAATLYQEYQTLIYSNILLTLNELKSI
jgi:hypothetical protein